MSTPGTHRVRLLTGSAIGALAFAALSVVPEAATAAAGDEAVARSQQTTVTDVRTIGELRKAVRKANKRPGKDRINLRKNIKFKKGDRGSGGPKTGDLDVTDDLVIGGRGRKIDANGIDRIFDVTAGTKLVVKRVRMRGGDAPSAESGGAVRSAGKVVLRNSSANGNTVSGEGASGGALANDGGTLIVVNTRLAHNTAARAGGAVEANGGTTRIRKSRLTDNYAGTLPGNGGAVHLTGAGTVSVSDSRVANNTATAEGGGLWNSADGTFSVDQAEIMNNVAGGNDADQGGGGLFNDGGDLTVRTSQVEDNSATGLAGSGGGILNNLGSVQVEKSTISGNSAKRAGGAIEANVGTTSVSGSTLSDNRAGAAPGNGGAVHLTGAGTVDVARSDVTGNTAAAEGGGLWNSAGGTFTVDHSLVADNSAGGNDADQGGGGLFNDGGSLSVSNSRVEDNSATGTSGSGGGILNNLGSLVVDRSTLSGNSAQRAGGAIEANVGSTSVQQSTLADNSAGAAPGNGGAVHLTGAGTVDVADSDVTDNTAAAEGGGLWNSAGGTFTVDNTEVSGNTAGGAAADQGGGGLFNDGGTLTVTDSQVLDNSATGAAGSGGGILNDRGTLSVSGTTMSGNSSQRAGGAIETNVGTVDLSDVDLLDNTTGAAPGNGGGLHVSGAGVVTYDTGEVTGNSAANEGGGLWNSSTGTITATNVSAHDNTAPVGPNVFTQPGGTFTLNGMVVPPGDNAISS